MLNDMNVFMKQGGNTRENVNYQSGIFEFHLKSKDVICCWHKISNTLFFSKCGSHFYLF